MCFLDSLRHIYRLSYTVHTVVALCALPQQCAPAGAVFASCSIRATQQHRLSNTYIARCQVPAAAVWDDNGQRRRKKKMLGSRNAMKTFGLAAAAAALCFAGQASAGPLHGVRSALMTQQQQQQQHRGSSSIGMSHGGSSRRGWNVEVREWEVWRGVGRGLPRTDAFIHIVVLVFMYHNMYSPYTTLPVLLLCTAAVYCSCSPRGRTTYKRYIYFICTPAVLALHLDFKSLLQNDFIYLCAGVYDPALTV